jgi:hypothetical protein
LFLQLVLEKAVICLDCGALTSGTPALMVHSLAITSAVMHMRHRKIIFDFVLI